jgi:hypothetical protein
LGQTITLSGTELSIDKNLTIAGPGARSLAISGGNVSRVFTVAAGVQVTLSGMTIENGDGVANGLASGVAWDGGYDNYGGGVLNFGTLTLSGCAVTGNTAVFSDGGGIANALGGTLTLAGCTVCRNLAREGGGIYNAGTLTLSATTVTQNQNGVGGYGAGITNDFSGTLTILSSTVKNNCGGADLFSRGTWSADSGSTIGTVRT